MIPVGSRDEVAKDHGFGVIQMHWRREIELSGRDHSHGIGGNARHRFLPLIRPLGNRVRRRPVFTVTV
jgi:hypothetical protein